MTLPGSPPRDRTTRAEGRRSLSLALVCLVTVVAFETMSVATIMPDVRRELGGLALYGWAFSGLALGEVVGVVTAGWWADRANPVQPISAGLAVYAVGLVVSGTAGSMLVVVLGRGLQGLGAGSVPAVAYVCVARGYAEVQRPRVFAWMSTAWVVPSLIGPAAAGSIAESVGWRWVFIGLVPVVAVVGAVALGPIAALGAETAATGSESGSGGRVNIFGPTAVAVLGTGAALAALQLRQVAAAVPLAALGLAALAWSMTRIAPAGTLRLAPGMPAAIATRGLLTFSFLGADAFVSLALTAVRGTSIFFAGVALSSSAVTWTAGSWISARTIARVGARPLVVTGLGIVVSGIGVMATTISTSIPIAFAIVAWLIAGLGIGLAYAPLTQVVLSRAPADQLGFCTSALQLSDVLGTALGAGFGGALVAVADRTPVLMGGSSERAGVTFVWALTAAAGLMGVVGALRLGSVRPRPAG